MVFMKTFRIILITLIVLTIVLFWMNDGLDNTGRIRSTIGLILILSVVLFKKK